MYSKLLQAYPDLKIGVIHYKNINVAAANSQRQRVPLYQENLASQAVNAHSGIAEWRSLLPKHVAPLYIEECLLQVQNRQSLNNPQAANALNDYLMLQYETPIVLLDYHSVPAEINISLRDNTPSLLINGKIFYTICQELNAQYHISDSTTEALQFFFLRPSLTKEDCRQKLNASAELFCELHGGNYSTHVLSYYQTQLQL